MSNVTIEFHRLARGELRKAFGWYEKRRDGLGRLLVAEVDRAADQIAADPERWPIFRKQYRWARLKRFPYVLYFVIAEPSRVVVLAIAHSRRRSGYWQSRAKRP